MKRKQALDTGTIREILRRGDPAIDPGGAEEALTPEEVAGIRRRVLQAAEEIEPFPFRMRLAAAGLLAGMVLIAGLVLRIGGPAVHEGDPAQTRIERAATERGRSTNAGAPTPRPARTIHFVTAGGTRVIWSLDPAFDV